MSIESDGTRLLIIKSSGGVRIDTDAGYFYGIFDGAFTEQQMGVGIESRAPAITARSSDVARTQLVKDSAITVRKCPPMRMDDEAYRVKRLEPDGTGMTIVVLKL